ncbi:MAG: DUF72 domain-containing protein [Caldimicrobium sp.]
MIYHIGTSGWSYPSFKNIFYPPDLKYKDWLKYYSKYFNTVEINVTFYRTPKPSTFRKWYEETPSYFVFSIKAPKIITHIKKLREVKDSLDLFLKNISPLQEKAKVVLFQLPPSLTYNREIIEEFLHLLPKNYKNVFEIRHKSFHNEEFVKLLIDNNVCLCFSDCGKRYPSWLEVKTTYFLYIRLHGSKQLYVSNYEEEELENLLNLIKKLSPSEVYIYFDNTALGYAVKNALFLKEKVLKSY